MNLIFIILSTCIALLFGYLRYCYTYWELRGIKQLKTHFLFGNIFKMRSMHHAELLQEVYDTFKGQVKIAGTYIFTKPIAVVLDLDVVKAILIKDFQKFTDRTDLHIEDKEPLAGHLFLLYGDRWRNLRTKLTPTFTSGKMKFMFPTIVGVAQQLEEAFHSSIAASIDGAVEMHDILGRFTTDVIGTCAFGLECNSLKDPSGEFRSIGRKLFNPNKTSIRMRILRETYANILKYFGVRRMPDYITKFILRVVRDTVATREREHIKRNDFINILIELKNSKDSEDHIPGLSIEEMAAQVFVFFVAGFETSSSNMSYGLYELSKNPKVQEKLRTEILEVLASHNGVLTYEAMMEMNYLDQVISGNNFRVIGR